jgi:hypothetical protein
MTDNELTWKLVERIEELASAQRPTLRPGQSADELAQRAEMITENELLRRELSEVKAKHDILLHEFNESQERAAAMDSILAKDPVRNEKLDALIEKVKVGVRLLDWVVNPADWTFMSNGGEIITLQEVREAIGWVAPEVAPS